MGLFSRQQHSSSTNDEDDEDEEYYVYPVDPSMGLHNADHLFCDDPTCPCHEDQDNMATLQGWYDEGLIGESDGKKIYRGQTLDE